MPAQTLEDRAPGGIGERPEQGIGGVQHGDR
jgi:hypothetical protein